ncbi:MAG TPA: metallophosphoesterase [Actinomycetota bacterium]|nr:metallophosphoesterase [Actinomycetota bacterium]
MRTDIDADVLADLLRSGWIVEAARARVLRAWAEADERFDAASARAEERADLVLAALTPSGRGPDDGLLLAHARWMAYCAGGPEEVFADLFLARLGGWVDAHVAPFMARGADRLVALGREETASLAWPETMPPAPPFAPLDPPPERGPDVAARIAVLGDLHLGSPDAEALARAAVADVNAAGADLVVQLGDLTDRGEPQEFQAASRLLADLEAPWVAVMGNHDAYRVSEERLAGRTLFEHHLGRSPDGALVEVEGFRVAVLDSVEQAVSPFPPYDLVSGTFTAGRGGASVRGVLSPRQHDILADVAAPGSSRAFVFLHHPPQPFSGFPPVVFGLRDADTGRLHATCDAGNVWGVFAGHTHRNHAGRGFDGVPVREVAAVRDFPFGYAIIDASPEGYTFSFAQISHEQLLRTGYERTGAIQRRYSLGAPHERAFRWAPHTAGR